MNSAVDQQPAIPIRTRGETPWLRRLMVLAILLISADALFGERGIAERVRINERYRQTEQQLAAIRAENAALRNQIQRLETDAATIEAIARAEFGFAKPGELLVVVRDK